MLVVKIEYWPYGNENKAETIATAEIINDATGTPDSGNYKATFKTRGKRVAGAEVKGFPRNEKNAWELVHAALQIALKAQGNET